MIQPPRVERTGTADNAVDLITLGQQQFRQIGSILASNAGDQSAFHRNPPGLITTIYAQQNDQNGFPRFGAAGVKVVEISASAGSTSWAAAAGRKEDPL
jgi:hypothetical protein